MHGDIKPANMLLTAQGNALLADVGHGQLLEGGVYYLEGMTTAFTTAIDTFCLGATFWVLLKGKHPMEEVSYRSQHSPLAADPIALQHHGSSWSGYEGLRCKETPCHASLTLLCLNYRDDTKCEDSLPAVVGANMQDFRPADTSTPAWYLVPLPVHSQEMSQSLSDHHKCKQPKNCLPY